VRSPYAAWGRGDYFGSTEWAHPAIEERVLVLGHFSGRGKASGLELGQMRTKGASLFHVRGGEVTRFVIYWVREHAFADLGLAPEGGAGERAS
jgi:hypothetical protein